MHASHRITSPSHGSPASEETPNLSIKDAKSPGPSVVFLKPSSHTSSILLLQASTSISPQLCNLLVFTISNTATMQFNVNTILAALAMASFASAQGNGLCIEKGAEACSGQYPKECSVASGTGVIFTSCCLSTVTCTQP
ncbi:hypothetical protein PG993_008922 [Apiospora rasikravindrae]|uniref:Uncharacterized protein n=1 Tax=Apiospora rasikravindrae TaxID=990691 RepID=A0ABR1SPQ6_9PEZI